MSPLDSYEIADLKLIYRVLHGHLMEHEELMDSTLFHALQTFLQSRAKREGIDLADHAQWDAWLGQAHTPCGERVAARRTLKPVD